MDNPCLEIPKPELIMCSDRKCLRHVCPRHLSSLTFVDVQEAIIFPYTTCPDRIRMKGDEDEC